jgi:uncharacterized protein DUF4352
MSRILVVVALALLLTSACRGDDENDAADPGTREQAVREAAEGAFAAFRDAKTDEFYSYFSDDFHDRCDIDDFRRVMAIAQVFITELEQGEFTIEEVTFEGDDRATVEATFESPEEDASVSVGDSGGFLDFWVLEDGEWKTDTEDENPCDVSSSFGGDDDGEETSETPAATGPGTSREEAVPSGDTVRTLDLEATVIEMNLDATEEVLAQYEFAEQPAPGNRYVLITVRVRHAGGGPETLTVSSSDFKITGSGNILYDNFNDHSCGFIDGELRGELFAGGELEGHVCFQVPQSETALILVADPFFSFEDSDRRYLALE